MIAVLFMLQDLALQNHVKRVTSVALGENRVVLGNARELEEVRELHALVHLHRATVRECVPVRVVARVCHKQQVP